MTVASLIETWVNWNDIFIFEKNSSFGKKLLMTWGWRCNLTTWINNRKELLSKYVRWADFIEYALNFFPPNKVFKWFEDHWLKLKTEKDLRVFPISDNSYDVLYLFENIFKKNNINCRYLADIISTSKENWIFKVTCSKSQSYNFDILILASWWDLHNYWKWVTWYDLAKSLWHSISNLWPSLSSLMVKEEWIWGLSWISLSNAKIEIVENWKLKNIWAQWSIIFTHFGISGPATFAFSAQLAQGEISEINPIEIRLILFADIDFENWNHKLINTIQENPKKIIKNILSTFMQERLANAILWLINIDWNKSCWSINKEERKNIVHLLTWKLALTIIWRRQWDEFVTAWWVYLNEINNKTMESKICTNLYFAWEIIDVDALTWGFNLQTCWSTWNLVWKSIKEKMNNI